MELKLRKRTSRRYHLGRLEKEIRTYDFLDALRVPYQRIDHETLMTIEELVKMWIKCLMQ
ncbi:MAG: hypothetical protein ACLTER_23840 [Ruminococcus sp.]